MTPYATVDQLTTWLAELGLATPENADGLLRSATVLVAAAANRDPYNDAPTGVTAEVLRDATTAQAAAWITLGVTPAGAGLDAAPVKSKKLGPGDITYDTSGQSEARALAATALAPEAEKILYTAGLLALTVPVGADEADDLIDYFGTGITVNRVSADWWHNL